MSSLDVGSEEKARSRKERREQARGQRRALEQAQAADAARRKRLTQLAVVTTVVCVGIVAVFIAAGSSRKRVPGPAPGTRVGREVDALLAGIPQSGDVLGSPTAPVTLQYYGDLECPFCREFTLTSLPTL